MKQMLIITLYITCASAFPYDIDAFKRDLNNLERLTHDKFDVFNWADSLDEIGEFVFIQGQIRPLWQQAIANWDAVAPTDEHKAIMMYAMEGISPLEYVEFMSTACDLYEQKRISKRVYSTAVSPVGRMTTIDIDNYQDPRVRAILQRELKFEADDLPRLEAIETTLSGKVKKHRDEMRARFRGRGGEFDTPVIELNSTPLYVGKSPDPVDARRVLEPGGGKPKNPSKPVEDGSKADRSSSHAPIAGANQPSVFSGNAYLWATLATILTGLVGWLVLRSRKNDETRK